MGSELPFNLDIKRVRNGNRFDIIEKNRGKRNLSEVF